MHSIADTPPSVRAEESRRHERVTFFLLPVKREQIPVWVFVPPGFPHGFPALVMNLSEGGVQVFAPSTPDWGTGPLILHLLDGADEASTTRHFSTRVRRLWRKTVSHTGDLHGLAFETQQDDAVRSYLAQNRPDPLVGRWVRCVIERAST